MKCIYCNSKKIVENGYAPSRKKRFKCNKCNKTFSKDSNMPPTHVEFNFISFILYWTRDDSLDSALARANNLIKIFKKGQVPVYKRDRICRSTLYKWRKKEYQKYLSYEEAISYYQDKLIEARKNFNSNDKRSPPDYNLSVVKVEETIEGIKNYTDGLWILKTLLAEEEFKKLITEKDKLQRIIKEFKKPIELEYECEIIPQ